MDATELEDIYLPYKPKRRTRAQIAREQGLEPLAMEIMSVAASSNPSVGRRTALSCLSEKERDKLASAWQEYQGGTKGSLFVREPYRYFHPFGGVRRGFSHPFEGVRRSLRHHRRDCIREPAST